MTTFFSRDAYPPSHNQFPARFLRYVCLFFPLCPNTICQCPSLRPITLSRHSLKVLSVGCHCDFTSPDAAWPPQPGCCAQPFIPSRRFHPRRQLSSKHRFLNHHQWLRGKSPHGRHLIRQDASLIMYFLLGLKRQRLLLCTMKLYLFQIYFCYY